MESRTDSFSFCRSISWTSLVSLASSISLLALIVCVHEVYADCSITKASELQNECCSGDDNPSCPNDIGICKRIVKDENGKPLIVSGKKYECPLEKSTIEAFKKVTENLKKLEVSQVSCSSDCQNSKSYFESYKDTLLEVMGTQTFKSFCRGPEMNVSKDKSKIIFPGTDEKFVSDWRQKFSDPLKNLKFECKIGKPTTSLENAIICKKELQIIFKSLKDKSANKMTSNEKNYLEAFYNAALVVCNKKFTKEGVVCEEWANQQKQQFLFIRLISPAILVSDKDDKNARVNLAKLIQALIADVKGEGVQLRADTEFKDMFGGKASSEFDPTESLKALMKEVTQ